MPLFLDQLNSVELEKLPRDSTVFFFPLGALEEHGPHLSLGLDLHEAQTLCKMAAERLEAERPGWTAILMPAAPLSAECNTSRFAFSVRGYVLRDYLVDVGSTLLRQGFRYLVAFSGNPSPRNLVAVEEASRILYRRSKRIFRTHSRLQGLVSAQSGATHPSSLFTSIFGSDPSEHGGARDTSVALWIYQGTPQEPTLSFPSQAKEASLIQRISKKWNRTLSGYWGDPSKASVFRGQTALKDIIDDSFPRLQAWFNGTNPQTLFRSWYFILPSNRTTFRAWLLLMLLALLFTAYVYLGTLGLES